MSGFTIHATGHAEIPHLAERARINVIVASSGLNKAAVSDEVITTAKHIEALCRDLSPTIETPAAKEAAALAHWSKTGLSATSHIPYHHPNSGPPPPRNHDAKIHFDIRFKEFTALGAFGSKLSALPHVEVNSISWLLTSTTEKAYRSQLRKDAARDALQKARDYCEVLGCTKVRPLELEEAGQNGFAARNAYAGGSASVNPQMQTAPSAMRAGSRGLDQRDEGEFTFQPQELKMSMEVHVKFLAE